MKKINFNQIKSRFLNIKFKETVNALKTKMTAPKKKQPENIYSGASNKNKLNALKERIFSNKGAVIFVLAAVVLAFMTCSKKEDPSALQESSIDETVAEQAVTPVDAVEIKNPVTDKSFEVMLQSRDILQQCHDVLEKYYNDMANGKDESVKRVLQKSQDLLEDINALEKDKLSEEDCLSMIEKTDQMLDQFTGLFSMNMPLASEIDKVIKTISGTMWLDDELNAYGFETDGHTLYMVNADGTEQFEGTYELQGTEKGYIQITTDIADKKTVALISQCTKEIFEYTDLDSGVTTLLMPVSY